MKKLSTIKSYISSSSKISVQSLSSPEIIQKVMIFLCETVPFVAAGHAISRDGLLCNQLPLEMYFQRRINCYSSYAPFIGMGHFLTHPWKNWVFLQIDYVV